MRPLHRFGLGAAGAAAPELLRIYKILSHQVQGTTPDFSFALFVVSLLLVCMGGLLALASRSNDPLMCLYLGVTFPATISGWAQTGLPPPRPTGGP